jgi:peptide/nickel transport system permease protein
MAEYIVRRLGHSLILIISVSMITFLVIQAPPGDYANYVIMRFQNAPMTEEIRQIRIEEVRRRYNLDDPLHMQYVHWIWGIVTKGDFGLSFSWEKPISRLLRERMPITLMIGLLALFFQYVVAIPIGVFTALKQNSVTDYGITFFSFLGMSIPGFLLALVLIVILFNTLNFPVGGLYSPEYRTAPWSVDKFVDLAKHLVVPVVVVAASSTAGTIRVLRATLLDEFGKDYMRVARAKGLSEGAIIFKYPLRVAMNPIIAGFGWSLPLLVSGSLLVSLVANIPDLGPLLHEALQAQDMYLAGSILLMVSTLTIVGTLISDILLAISDPRISYSGVHES